MANDALFVRQDRFLSSASNGEVDLGCPIPSPALLLSTNTFSDKWWPGLGGKAAWKIRWEACPQSVKNDARFKADSILGDTTAGKMEKIRRLAESTHLCALMDAMHAAGVGLLAAVGTPDLDRKVAVDTPLAEALAVRKENAPSTPCHEVVVSSMDHEIKSISGYRGSNRCFCYARTGPVTYSCVAVGGVCLNVTSGLGDFFQPVAPGKLVIYQSEWMGPWAATLCIIGAANTMLMIIFLAVTPIRQGLTTHNPAFWVLLANVLLEGLAIGIGWSMRHRWQMGWRGYLVKLDPFHALLTADRADAIRVAWILGLEAAGGAASVVGIAFTSGVPLEVLSTLALPVLSSFSTVCLSNGSGFRTPLIVGAMAFYLLEFLYEIVILSYFDDSVLGWVVIVSCIAESMSLLWIIGTLLFALHFLSTTEKEDKHTLLSHRAPARIRDGTLTALRLPELPTGGLMGTSALGSVYMPGAFVPNGGSAIKAGTTSYKGWTGEEMPVFSGWLSLKKCGEWSPFVKDRDSFTGKHEWLGDIVVACGLAIPVLG